MKDPVCQAAPHSRRAACAILAATIMLPVAASEPVAGSRCTSLLASPQRAELLARCLGDAARELCGDELALPAARFCGPAEPGLPAGGLPDALQSRPELARFMVRAFRIDLPPPLG